jgi:hypothetical protein
LRYAGHAISITSLVLGLPEGSSALAHFFDAAVGEGWLAFAHLARAKVVAQFDMSREEAVEDGGITDSAAFV